MAKRAAIVVDPQARHGVRFRELALALRPGAGREPGERHSVLEEGPRQNDPVRVTA